MLDDVGQGFRDEKVRGELDGVGQPISDRSFHRDRQRRPPRERLDCRLEPLLAEERRVDPAGELAQLGDRLLDLVLCARQHVRVGRVTTGSREPEREGERDEPLLSAVVEVALDSPPLGIGRGDEPDARRPHLRELRAHLGRQTLVLQHEPGRRADGLHERRLVEQRRIVNERGDLLALGGHQRDRPIRALRQLERPPGGVDVAAVVEAIRNLERRVAEHPGESLAEAGRPLCPQLDDELGRLPSTQPRPDDPSDDPERDEQRDCRDRSSRASERSRRSRSPRPTRARLAGAVRAARDEQRRLRASCGPAQSEQTRSRAGRAPPAPTAMPRIACARSTASATVCCGATESTSRESGSTKAADELTAERCRVCAGDRDPGGTRPRTPLGKRQHDLDEERYPQPFEQEAERPQGVRARPLEIRGQKRERSGGEQNSRTTPARPLQRDEGGRDESPRQREVCRDAGSRGARVGPEPADGEARTHDRGHEEHRVTERRFVSATEVTTVDDITRRERRTQPPTASTSG